MTEELLETSYNSIQAQLNSDPRIAYMIETFRCIAYTFINNIKTWIKLAHARQSISDPTNPYTRSNITSGQLYNRMVVSGQFNSTPTAIEITDEEFDHICSSFVYAASQTRHISNVVANTKDPKQAMFDVCYVFFIPLRMLASSIPLKEKLISLRKWINVVFVLPFINVYTIQHNSTIPSIGLLNEIYNTLRNDIENNNGDRVNKLASITMDNIVNIFISNAAASNNSIKFMRLSMNILLFASIDIIKHYCPNFMQCNMINKEFDGSWVTICDPFHMKHISKLSDLQEFLKI